MEARQSNPNKPNAVQKIKSIHKQNKTSSKTDHPSSNLGQNEQSYRNCYISENLWRLSNIFNIGTEINPHIIVDRPQLITKNSQNAKRISYNCRPYNIETWANKIHKRLYIQHPINAGSKRIIHIKQRDNQTPQNRLQSRMHRSSKTRIIETLANEQHIQYRHINKSSYNNRQTPIHNEKSQKAKRISYNCRPYNIETWANKNHKRLYIK